MQSDVFIAKTAFDYPAFPFDDLGHPMFGALAGIFHAWGKNPENPFADCLGAGGTLVVKPNWVTHQNMGGHCIEAMLTHSSLIKYVIDFAGVAMEGRGNIIIGDSPLQGCDFNKLITTTHIDKVIARAQKRYPKITFQVEDWRLSILDDDTSGVRRDDYTLVDLGTDSFLEDVSDYAERFRVSAYKKAPMLAHHHRGKHEYLITNRVRQADLFINLAKMKTHMKAGLTGAMKNAVGINGHKEFLPHYIKGAYPSGGDAYMRSHPVRALHEDMTDWLADRYAQMSPVKRRFLSGMLDALRWGAVLCGGESTSLGSWSGNDTLWRTILDINHILYFSKCSPKKIITIVDGVIAGQGQGPLKPEPKDAGLIIAGENPAYIDAVIAKLLGYNVSRIPTVYNAIFNQLSKFDGSAMGELPVTFVEGDGQAKDIHFDDIPNLAFKKPKFWKHAEADGSR